MDGFKGTVKSNLHRQLTEQGLSVITPDNLMMTRIEVLPTKVKTNLTQGPRDRIFGKFSNLRYTKLSQDYQNYTVNSTYNQ